MQFTEDARYQRIADAYAFDAVDYARENMKLTLDWTDQSIQVLESILDLFHQDVGNAKPNEKQIAEFSKIWGSYLGEVYRKNHGGTWGLVIHGEQSFPGMRGASGTLFWPWGKVQNRLRNGPEDNVLHYYLDLTGQLQSRKAD